MQLSLFDSARFGSSTPYMSALPAAIVKQLQAIILAKDISGALDLTSELENLNWIMTKSTILHRKTNTHTHKYIHTYKTTTPPYIPVTSTTYSPASTSPTPPSTQAPFVPTDSHPQSPQTHQHPLLPATSTYSATRGPACPPSRRRLCRLAQGRICRRGRCRRWR